MNKNIQETVELGNIKVEIDEWGGAHFHIPDDIESPLSLSPHAMGKIEEVREKVE